MPCFGRTGQSWIWRAVAVVLFLQCAAGPVRAWGPHPAITQAALDALGTNDALVLLLGPQAQRLTNYCWMADFKRLPFKEPDQDFYADDYLLFPQATKHYDHICPEVKKTYEPYFKRALQALRTESPANAARWIGSLLHFVEDTGSPPHAAEIRGGVHGNMENWVDASRILLPEYRPQSLGTNDASALAGFLRRMDGLIEFSKPRGRKLITPVLIGNQGAVKPVVLESALETSRVVADLLHTLGSLSGLERKGSGALIGEVISSAAPGMARVPARVVVKGTDFSTMTDPSGRFEFHGLGTAAWDIAVFRPGSATTNLSVSIAEGRTNSLRIVVPASPANLIRNGDLQVKWLQPGAPDCWTKTSFGWEGEIIPLMDGQRYELSVKFKPGTDGTATARWTRQLPYTLPQNTTLPKIDSSPLTPANSKLEFTGSPSMALLQVSIRTKGPPEEVCEGTQLIALPSAVER